MNSIPRGVFRIVCFALLLVSPQVLHADLFHDCDRFEDPPRAIHACSKLLSVFPGNAALHNKRGGAYIKNGQIDLAIADYTRRKRSASLQELGSLTTIAGGPCSARMRTPKPFLTSTKPPPASQTTLLLAMGAHGRSSS